MLKPGSTIGILGGGQLGRMLGVAAAQLGYRTHIYAPDAESIAAHVAAQHSQAAWDDEPRLAAFAAGCDAVTIEFENVPVDTVRFLSGHVAVHPGARALEIAQDRLAEKSFVAALGGRTAPFAGVADRAALDAALGETDAAARDAAFQGVCKATNANLPWATMWVANRYGVASTKLENFVWTPAPAGGPFQAHPEKWSLAE